IVVLGGAEIANRGNAGFESFTGVLLRQENRYRRHAISAPLDATRAVGNIGHVSMDIDEAGKPVIVGTIDQLRDRRRRGIAWLHAADAVILDHNQGAVDYFAAVPQFAETNRSHPLACRG